MNPMLNSTEFSDEIMKKYTSFKSNNDAAPQTLDNCDVNLDAS